MKEILINKTDEKTVLIVAENGNMVEKYEETPETKRIEGGIYLGRVVDVLPGLQAAFVDIGDTKNAFIHLKDVVPQQDITKSDYDDTLKDQDIRNILKKGDKILVQVIRDSKHKKGARISTHISIPNKYIVFMPDTDIVTVSSKIENKSEIERLTKLVKNKLPQNCGAIIRTSAEGKSEQELANEIKNVEIKWNNIQNKVQNFNGTITTLIEKQPSMIQKVLTDIIEQNIDKIVVDDEEIFNIVKKHITNNTTELVLSKTSVLKMYDLEKQIQKLQNRKVWLSCGGYIIIDKTEALTAIDVNSGKYTGNSELEKTVLKVNKEASLEIAKQLRLRDISGIIIIDYIDMKEEKSREEIIEVLEKNLKKDRSKTQVIGFSKLNLLEMTRKHIFSQD